MNGGLTAAQLLRLLAVVAILLLVCGREVGAARAILVVLTVIIVCTACVAPFGAGLGAGVAPFGAGYGMSPYGMAPFGAGAYGARYYDGF